MNVYRISLTCLYVIGLWLMLAARIHAETIVTVNNSEFIAQLQPYLEYWVPGQPINIDAASNIANNDNFKPAEGTAIAAIGRDVWYRFTLKASPEYAQRLILAFEQTKYQEVDVYTPDKTGWQISKIGLARPYSERALDYRFLAAPLPVPANEAITIYFRVLSLRGIAVAPLLEVDTVFFSQSVEYSIFSGLIIGALITLLVYIAMVSRLTLRGAQLGWLLCFISTSLFSILYYDGFFASNIESNVKLTEIIPFLIPGLLNTTALFFCRYLFDMPQQMKILSRLLFLPIAGYFGIAIFVVLLSPDALPVIVTRTIGSLSLLLLLAIAVRAIMLNITGCYYYAIGMLFYISGGIIISLSAIGFWSLPATGRLFLFGTAVLQTLFFCVAALQLLTTMRRREQLLEKAAVEANTRAEVQSGFLITMSHEIRTPINGVLGMAQMLEKTPLNSNQRYFLEILSDAGKTLLSVINEILDLSKIQAGKLEIESIYFDVNNTLLSIAGLFGQACEQKKIDFVFRNDPELPLHLIGDPNRLQQILNNLLSNAAKFTHSGKISLSTKLMEKTGADKVLVRFTVEDTGIGISEDGLNKLFLPFSQTEKSINRHYGGTGLGLAICKHLVELMGGSIHVKSTIGKGSTFWFDLPMKISIQEQRIFQSNIKQLKNKRICWCVRSANFVEDYNNALLAWGALIKFVDPIEDTDNLDWQSIDILIISNGLSDAQIRQWIDAAQLNKKHILLIESYGTTTDSEDQVINNVLHLPRPAGHARLVEFLLKAMSDARNPDIGTPSIKNNVAGLNVLVAEDNDVNIKVLQALFNKYDIGADYVGNGQLAIDAFCKNPGSYDAILMDCDMPVLDGFEASRAIRQFEKEHDFLPVTIIAVTAHALQETHEQCIASGMNDILTKPANFPALLSLLGKVSRRSKRQLIASD